MKDVLRALFVMLVLGVSIAAPLCLFTALFSQRARNSVKRYRVAHAVWFTAGILIVLFFLTDMSRNTEVAYARRVVFGLQHDRDWALQSDAPQAAKILGYVHEGTNTKQKPGSPLDEICTLQRSNVIHDIVAYLRAKTGEDLGEQPEPWIQKYAPKN